MCDWTEAEVEEEEGRVSTKGPFLALAIGIIGINAGVEDPGSCIIVIMWFVRDPLAPIFVRAAGVSEVISSGNGCPMFW